MNGTQFQPLPQDYLLQSGMPLSELEHRIKLLTFRMRQEHPYMGTLMLYSRPILTHYVGNHFVRVAMAEGKFVYINPDAIAGMTTEAQLGLMLHEVLHNALGHPLRVKWRDPERCNIAADQIVNLLVEQYRLSGQGGGQREIRPLLPFGGVHDPSVAGLSMEEAYLLIPPERGGGGGGGRQGQVVVVGAGQGQGQGEGAGQGEGEGQGQEQEEWRDIQVPQPNPGKSSGQERRIGPDGRIHTEPRSEVRQNDDERYWKAARSAASGASKMAGKHDANLERAVEAASPRMPWRDLLWERVIQTRGDFQGYRRAFIHQDLYLDDDSTEGLDIDVCIDTSGSVSQQQISEVLGEVSGILRSYPEVHARLYTCDTRLHGPQELDRHSDVSSLEIKGGGGTDLRPFFEATRESLIRVYLTDGYGPMPNQEPGGHTVWCVIPGGARDEAFSFGEVLRMLEP